MMNRLMTLTVAIGAVWLAACGTGDGIGPIDVSFGDYDVIFGDYISGDIIDMDSARPDSETGTVTDNGPCESTEFDYVDPLDNEESGWNIVMVFNGRRDLRVRHTACGSPIEDTWVTFMVIEDEKGLCSILGPNAYTDEDGVATAKVQNIVADYGDCRIQACLGDEPETCLDFVVRIDPKEVTPLIVTFEPYDGMYMIDYGEVALFRQDETGHPNCSDFDPRNLETLEDATIWTSADVIYDPVKFSKLPNLGIEIDEEIHQNYTVFGFGKEGEDGLYKAFGCNDTDGMVEYGVITRVELELNDIPPTMKGTWDITSQFDLVSGLPDGVANVIYILFGFLESPTGQLLMLLCDETLLGMDEPLGGSFCEWIFANPADPVLGEYDWVGEIAVNIIDALLMGLLVTQCPFEDPEMCANIWYTSKDVADILTKFRMKSTMYCSKEPDLWTGEFATGDCRETWHTFIFRWTLGKDCDPADETCGAMVFSFDMIPGIDDPISADISGRLIDGVYLEIDEHPLNLKYGAIINFAIEKILLPQLFGDGKDGLPAVDSYEDLFGSLLAGKECLSTGDCCYQFAENLLGQTGNVPGLAISLIEGACESLQTIGSEYLRSFLTELDATPENFLLGTPKDSPALMYDDDKDMNFDTIGKVSDQVLWDAKLKIGSAVYSPAGTFYGIHR